MLHLACVQTSLIGESSKYGNSSTTEIRTRPSFKELLAKYENEGAAEKQKGWSDEAKDTKSTSTCSEQSDPRTHQGNCVVMPHSGPVTPWFWPYPCYYIPLDYSRMYMQPYYIQYPSIYPSCIPQRPISNNLVEKDLNCNKEGEKDVKKNSKYLQPRWCLSGLSHSQKRRLQHLRRVTYEKSSAPGHTSSDLTLGSPTSHPSTINFSSYGPEDALQLLWPLYYLGPHRT